jgi:large subunit ribosomal protein L1
MAGKRLKAAYAKVGEPQDRPLKDAVKLAKECALAKFDETIDVAVNLGVDPKQADQMVRGMLALPAGTGKSVRVAVFAKGGKADEAKKAGADLVGDDELIQEVIDGKIDFDRCIATPDMMASLSKAARVLGPKGMMPNPKLGTVTNDVKEAVALAKAGQIEYRVEKNGIIHAGVGKKSFSEADLKKNLVALFDALQKAKPSSSKGIYFKKVVLSSTMGPSIPVEVASILAEIGAEAQAA